MASQDNANRVAGTRALEEAEPQGGRSRSMNERREVKVWLSGGVGPVGRGYEELKEARKKIWKGAFVLVVLGAIALLLLWVHVALAVLAGIPAFCGAVLLLQGWYEHYIHEHGLPKE